MGLNLVQKIFQEHLLSGSLVPGEEVAIRIDQTLTQDATGTMAYLQFEAMGIPRVKTRLSVSYVDHNMLQTGFENMDDHLFLQSIAAKYGIYFSKPGNGICHQVHLERFSEPGATMLGSDSHTPTSGGVGMIAIGAGGLDVAIAMGGGPFYLKMPKTLGVRLTGKLHPWVTAKDVILEVLRRLTVKGGVGKIVQYYGPGVKSLTVPERATITNMGAELGATTSIFPSDEVTRDYLAKQGRVKVWRKIEPDKEASYDEQIEIDLSRLEPLMACPQSPDNVKPIRELEGIPVQQVIIGSCTNSSYRDLMVAARVLKGKKVHPLVSMHINPGSKQVYENVAKKGALESFISAGARLNESGCLGCIGMGQSPGSGVNSVRSFNRNFPGRSGVKDDKVYLSSPEAAVAAALRGQITDPRRLGKYPRVPQPKKYYVDDSMILPPAKDPSKVEIYRGPNIKPLPTKGPMEDHLEGIVLLKVGDNITTDHIMPAGSKVLPLRSNIPAIAEYVFSPVDPNFPKRAREHAGGFVVGGSNYGQGSSREHAALAPMYLGLKAVIAKSFARIHWANLVNFGILPVTFERDADFGGIDQDDKLLFPEVTTALQRGNRLVVQNLSKGTGIPVLHALTPRQVEILLAGGLLNYTRHQASS